MKKFTAVFLAVFLLSSSTAFAGPFTKLGRGFTNILTGPGEVLVQIETLRQDNDLVTALFGGLFKGVAMTIARELGGVYDVVTFPISLPREYRPLWQPPTVVDALRELQD